MFSSDKDIEADYTLDRLWEEGADAIRFDREKAQQEGVDSLNGELPTPKSTYEIAEGYVGQMPFPKLGIREELGEINAELVVPLFRNDEDAELDEIGAGEDGAEAVTNSIKPGVTVQEFNEKIQRSNALQALAILDFDGEKPAPEEVSPEMASIVVNHFLSLRPGTRNGTSTS